MTQPQLKRCRKRNNSNIQESGSRFQSHLGPTKKRPFLGVLSMAPNRGQRQNYLSTANRVCLYP